MRYSLEPSHRKYVEGYGFLSPANKYGKKMMNAGKTVIISKQARDFAKTAGKKVANKTAEATGDLVGNKIVDKITSMAQTSKADTISEKERQIEKTQYFCSS